MTEKLILVANDDGVWAEGNVLLRQALKRVAKVVTVAPSSEQSGKGHAISLHSALRYREIEEDVYALNGTPVDCVYAGLHGAEFLPRRPDLVVSGINHGPNLGRDVYYSGTVGAAREAVLRGVPAIAFSHIYQSPQFAQCAELAADICERALSVTAPKGQAMLLNVNFPEDSKGIRVTRLGHRAYDEAVDERHDPRGRPYLWIGGPGDVSHPPIEGSDTEAVDNGYTSITPLKFEHTHPDHFGLAAFAAGTQETP